MGESVGGRNMILEGRRSACLPDCALRPAERLPYNGEWLRAWT
jgi:hypothetical protein